jgi:alkylation response protein AidB-like acyl-CoA dehydrogenase
MHTHLVVGAAWRWRNWNQPLDGLLRRVAEERLVLLTSGGMDWLDSSGKAISVEGGFLVSARKAFVSGAPAGDLLITSAICDDPQDGAMVLHFSVPMNSKGCTIEPTWNGMGMRATGSHDVMLSDVFVPERSVSAKRQKGKWHRMVHLSAMVPLPLIYSVYVGIAEAMRELTLQHVGNRRSDADTCTFIGLMENHLFAANLAVQDMVQTASSSEPGPTTTNRIMMGRSVVESSIRSLADVVMDVQGGAAYSRHNAFERMFRDLQGARYHTMKGNAQRQYAASLALGRSMD